MAAVMCIEHEPLFWFAVASMVLGVAIAAYLAARSLSRTFLNRVQRVLEARAAQRAVTAAVDAAARRGGPSASR